MCFPCCFSQELNNPLLGLGSQAYKASAEAIKCHTEAMRCFDKAFRYKENTPSYNNYMKIYHEQITKSAEMGLADAQRRVGTHYIDGNYGINKNRQEAKRWLQLAANQDDAIAKQYLDFLSTLRPDQSIGVTLQQGDTIIFSAAFE